MTIDNLCSVLFPSDAKKDSIIEFTLFTTRRYKLSYRSDLTNIVLNHTITIDRQEKKFRSRYFFVNRGFGSDKKNTNTNFITQVVVIMTVHLHK
jgi:hypothetical protein